MPASAVILLNKEGFLSLLHVKIINENILELSKVAANDLEGYKCNLASLQLIESRTYM